MRIESMVHSILKFKKITALNSYEEALGFVPITMFNLILKQLILHPLTSWVKLAAESRGEGQALSDGA